MTHATAEHAGRVAVITGGSAISFEADVADAAQVAALVDHVVDRHGGIDILINNAGLHSVEFSASCEAIGLDRLRRLFDVNVMGVLTCTLLAQPHMVGRPGASVVNISCCSS